MQSDVQLSINEYKEVRSPQVISSGGLGPCIAVGVYHKSKKKGYMLHAARPSGSAITEQFLDLVVEQTKNSAALSVYICGSSVERIDGEDGVDEAFEDREFVEDTVRQKLNTENIEINWASKDSTAELFLDSKNGEFFFEELPNDEMTEEREL